MTELENDRRDFRGTLMLAPLALVFFVVAGPVLAAPFTVLCDIHPVTNDKYRISRTYRIDPERETFEGYKAQFTNATITAVKPFQENTAYGDTEAIYTLSRLDGKLDIAAMNSPGAAPFIGVCRKAPTAQF